MLYYRGSAVHSEFEFSLSLLLRIAAFGASIGVATLVVWLRFKPPPERVCEHCGQYIQRGQRSCTRCMDVETYFAQPDERILAQISDLAVPNRILLDKDGWKLLCKFRGVHVDELPGDRWSDICDKHEALATLAHVVNTSA